VCRKIEIPCGEIYEVPIYARITHLGIPDFTSRVGITAVSEKLYAVEVSNKRLTPLKASRFVVAYRLHFSLTGDGFYVFYPAEKEGPHEPIVSEIAKHGDAYFLKRYNPEELEIYSPERLIVVGRVIQLTISGI